MFHRRPAATAALAAAFSLLTAAGAMAEDVYECAIKQHAENGSWVPEIVVAGKDGGPGEAVIYDPIIDHFVGHPLKGKVETDNDTRITFVWEVTIKSGSNQHARMAYRLTVQKANQKAQISARPLGYADNFTSQGTCKKAKG